MNFYIYRNLHLKDTFSVRVDGRVVARHTSLLAIDITFKVNPGGRARVLQEKRKNVHAFVVAKSIRPLDDFSVEGLKQVSYNPYRADTFMVDGEPIRTAQMVVFQHGKCWLLK